MSMINYEKIENMMLKKFVQLKKQESGIFELNINNYTVILETKVQGNNTILLCDGINQNIPNKFDKENRLDALSYYISVIKAVIDKAKYDDEINKSTIKKTDRLEALGIPNLSLKDEKHIQITN